MKKLIILFIMAAVFTACNSGTDNGKNDISDTVPATEDELQTDSVDQDHTIVSPDNAGSTMPDTADN